MIQPNNKRNKTFRRPVDLLRLKNRSSLNKDLLEIFAALHSWENKIPFNGISNYINKSHDYVFCSIVDDR